jgi:hypothetical protein
MSLFRQLNLLDFSGNASMTNLFMTSFANNGETSAPYETRQFVPLWGCCVTHLASRSTFGPCVAASHTGARGRWQAQAEGTAE